MISVIYNYGLILLLTTYSKIIIRWYKIFLIRLNTYNFPISIAIEQIFYSEVILAPAYPSAD